LLFFLFSFFLLFFRLRGREDLLAFGTAKFLSWSRHGRYLKFGTACSASDGFWHCRVRVRRDELLWK
jgi:hypothetical protein